MAFTPTERAAFYHTAFPNWPPPYADQKWLSGIFVMGNAYQGTGYYGSYPNTYLRRVMSLFPEAKRILHLFSGSLPPGDYVRFDRNSADVVGNAEHLENYFDAGRFDLVIADPPYTDVDARKYGCERNVNRQKVFAGAHHVLEPGGNLVWLDTIYPMWSKTNWKVWGLLGVVGSTNHRIRLASMFERLP